MRILVVTGRSGSGKSSALQLLEDEGFTCIDNLPANLLPNLITQYPSDPSNAHRSLAVGIDVRNLTSDFSIIQKLLRDMASNTNVELELVYLDALSDTLIKRFSETRRRHPLTTDTINLKQAIQLEHDKLEPLAAIASRILDTTGLSLHQLRSLLRETVVPDKSNRMAILFESFGFKRGVPIDVDFVFDVRSLPNPYWHHELREFNGTEKPIIDYLGNQPEVADMVEDIKTFVGKWIPSFQDNNRAYLTIGIGCTGGRHRSVYIVSLLREHFAQHYPLVQQFHRELSNAS